MMKLEQQETTSPLAQVSEQFQTRGGIGYTGIYDRVDEQLLELYPAGYTQRSHQDGTNRQDTYRMVWEHAVQQEKEHELFPFGSKQHRVELIPEPTNPHDEYAVKIVLRAERGSILESLDGKDLGYVPRKISKMVSQNIGTITSGKIFKVKKGHLKKYYGIKVVFSYGQNDLDPIVRPSMKRFARLARKR